MPKIASIFFTALCLLFAVTTTAALQQEPQDPEPKKEKRITIGIECGGQGVVDADWSFSFDIYNGDTKVNTKGPIEISVPTGTSSGPAAQRMAALINIHTGDGNAAEQKETEHQSYKGSPQKAEDVVVDDKYEIKNIQVTKEDEDATGHLKVLEWTYCPEEDESGAGDASSLGAVARRQAPSHGSPRDVLSTPATAVAAPAPAPAPLPETEVTLQLISSTASELAVEIILYGHAADGSLYSLRHDEIYPGWMPLNAVAGAIGAWAVEQGFSVQYPTPETVTISWDDAALAAWSAGAYVWVPDGGAPAGHVRFDAR